MSINKNFYVIAGYDLTSYKADKYDDWKWTEDGQKFLCHQSKDNIQLFDDPMSNSYLYLGYIFASGDEYDFSTTKFDIVNAEIVQPNVNKELNHLADIGVLKEDCNFYDGLIYEIIVFEECT